MDAKLLSESCELTTYNLMQSEGRLDYLLRILGVISEILLGGYQLIFVWFADYHAAMAVFLAKLLGLPCGVFIGGYDAVCYPSCRWASIAHPLEPGLPPLHSRIAT